MEEEYDFVWNELEKPSYWTITESCAPFQAAFIPKRKKLRF